MRIFSLECRKKAKVSGSVDISGLHNYFNQILIKKKKQNIETVNAIKFHAFLNYLEYNKENQKMTHEQDKISFRC